MNLFIKKRVIRLLVYVWMYIITSKLDSWRLYIKMLWNTNLVKQKYLSPGKKYVVNYKEIILPHRFFADFVVYDKIVLELKAVSGIDKTHVAQAINYLAISKNRLVLNVNFGELNYKRIIE